MSEMVRVESSGAVESVINRQLDLMEEQLRLLRGMSGGDEGPDGKIQQRLSVRATAETNAGKDRSRASGHVKRSEGTGGAKKPFVPYRKIVTQEERENQEERFNFLERLIDQYSTLTKTSKERTDHFRSVLANNRNIAGFRPKWKELIYQLQVERAEGSKVYDVDGNEYVDLTMGFGVYLFGHNPEFVRKEIEAELHNGASVGPMTPLADEVARKLAEVTGTERAAFYNSGTEAIMVALRLARATTGRSKVVIFSGSYHGTFDGILALPGGDGKSSVPLAPGVPQSMVDDVVVLPYNNEDSLDYIRRHADELAAVLAETVQSRRPDVQPKEFLQELRQITEASGTALIFDEVITGFRIHPGGAQHHFGIRADMVTYGKVIGGGMPLGIVAGKRAFLDAVDGGQWRFGDDSVPTKQNTFVAGTFCHHPLAMRATLAVLNRMGDEGEQICRDVNVRTAHFADALNRFFERVNVPIRVVHFGSLFRFELSGEWELLYFMLMLRGVYVWEGRNCFFSTEHSDGDIDKVRRSVVESVVEMIGAGFAPDAKLPDDVTPWIEGTETEGPTDPAQTATVLTVPMSSVERRIYALSGSSEGELAYHLNSGVLLEGEINPESIERTFSEIISRHESLRTGFAVEDEELVQKIFPEVELALERGEIRDNDIEAAFKTFIRPFDLEAPPLLRVGLFRLSEDRHLLLLDIHHIVSDGLSVAVIFDEFGALYRGESLPVVKTQYREVLEWEADFLKSPSYRKQEAFWKEVLARETEAILLPIDRTREGDGTFLGGALHCEYPPDALRRIARDGGSSMYMMLLAAFNALLYRIGGGTDFRIGVVHAGRGDDRFRQTVGMFANSLLFPSSVDPEMTFIDLLKQTREFALALYENYEYPFEHLARLDRRAVQDQRIGFSYERAFDRVLQVGQARGMEYFHDRFTSISDFALNVIEERELLQLRYDYSSDLFEQETIERIAGYFNRLLDQIAADPNKPIAEYVILPEEELQVVLGNHTGGPALDSLPDVITLFESWVNNTPDASALMFDGGTVSYRELNGRANGIAALLCNEHSAGQNSMVAVVAERSPEFIAAILGALKAGRGFLPIDPSLPDARIEYMLRDADVSVVLTTEKFAGRPALAGYQTVRIESISASEENSPKAIDFGQVAYMIYTSGSTGQPKGVMVSHGNLANYACWTSDVRINRNNVDVVSLHTAPSFDMIVGQIFPPLVTGKALYLHAPSLEIDRIMENVFSPDTPIDCAVLTPSHALLLEDLTLDRTNVKVASIGGEALGTHHTDILWGLNPEMCILNDYGPTEATVTCIVHHVNEDKRVNVVGRPVMNTSVYILDDCLNPCPIGVIGEICIGGASVALGYRNRPELTAERFIPHPFASADQSGEQLYRTGDLGRLLSDGTVEFLGRKDRQIKLFGHRIELDEIEAALSSLSTVSAAAVKLVKEENRQMLAAWIAAPEEVDFEDLRARLARQLPHYMVPGVFTRLEKLPLTSNGKIDFSKLPDPEIKEADQAEKEFPQNGAERDVADAWESVLGISGVGVHDNFYEVGGDSIKAIRIASRLRKFGYNVEGGTVMRAGTIRKIAAGLHASGVTISQEPVSGPVLLSPIQQWFFERAISNRDHWNQEIVLRRSGRIELSALRTAFEHVTRHHDALRMVFRTDEDGGAYNRLPEEGDAFVLEVYEPDGGHDVNQGAILKECLDRAHRKINIEAGPLISAVLLSGESEDVLAIATHHLVVDAVSWSVLAEDLTAACNALEKGEPVNLPRKTISFRDYTTGLVEYSKTEECGAEVPYWEAVENEAREAKCLPSDKSLETDLEAQTTSATFTLEKKQTELLLSGASRSNNTTMRELLTAALAIGLKRWTGEKKHAVLLEGHGRESFEGMGMPDRTVGWFTTTFPFVLDACNSADEAIVWARESLRSVPHNGIGYGVLRYMTPAEQKGALRFDLPTELLFNYLGELDFGDIDDETGFRVDIDTPGQPVAGDSPRNERIAVDAFIRNGRLHWTLFYNRDEYTEQTIERLCRDLQQAADDVATACSKTFSALRLSDLEYQGFENNSSLTAFLEANEAREDEIETIRSLTPMQEGMLFHHLTDPSGVSGLVQLGLVLRGKMDLALMEQAFQYVVSHYDALRTGFAWNGSPEPLSLVYRHVLPEFKLTEQPTERRAFFESDWQRGSNLAEHTQMRMTVQREAEDLHSVAWTVHHIVMDGWCIGLVFNTFTQAYDQLRAGKEPNIKPAPSYGTYAMWLGGYDRDTGLQFWKNYLNGFTKTSSLPQKKSKNNSPSNQMDLSIHFNEDEITALENLAAAQQTTTNTLVRTAWSLVLSHYAGENDLVYGGVVSGRPAGIEDVESIVGLFINTVPVRFQIDPDQSFAAHAFRVHQDALSMEPYHYTPLTDIQALSPLSTALFNHILVFENYPLDQELAQGLQSRDDFSIESVAFRGDEAFDLVLTVMLEHEREILFSYNSSRYSKQTIERAAQTMHKVLNRVADHPDETMGAIIAEARDRTEKKREKKSLRSLKDMKAAKVGLSS